jgi:hypothetical protein
MLRRFQSCHDTRSALTSSHHEQTTNLLTLPDLLAPASKSKSSNELVLLRLPPLVTPIILEPASPRRNGHRFKYPPSSVVLVLDASRVPRSDKSGIDSRSCGGTNLVKAEPDPDRALVVLSIERIVRIDPVGDCVAERSGTVTLRSSASLQKAPISSPNDRTANDLSLTISR